MKRKVWDITVKDNPNRVVMGENDEFYTTDTEAYLVFQLDDKNFNPTTAVLTLENRNDGSLKNETVDVVDGLIEWEMPQRYIEHFGNWQGQLVYEDTKDGQPELYTSAPFSFVVNAHIGDKKKPSLVEIENWEKFIREGTELIETWEDMEDLRQANEAQRQSNYQELLDTGVLQTNINQKLAEAEREYAPRLTELEQNDENLTTQLAQKVNQKEYIVTGYGAIGDGITDDTQAINDVIALAELDEGTIVFPSGYEFLVTSTIDFGTKVHVHMDSPIVYGGNKKEPCIIYGTKEGQTRGKILKFDTYRKTQSDWEDYSTTNMENTMSVGIKLINLGYCQITIVKSQNFTIGLEALAHRTGFFYNTIYLLNELKNNASALEVVSEDGGWANGNDFYEGTFSCSGNVNPGKSRKAISNIIRSGTYQNNTNRFYNPRFEGLLTSVGDGECIPIQFDGADYFSIIGARGEVFAKDYVAKMTNGATNNVITFRLAFTSAKWIDESENGNEPGRNTIYFEPRWNLNTRLTIEKRLVFDSGLIKDNVYYYQNNTANPMSIGNMLLYSIPGGTGYIGKRKASSGSLNPTFDEEDGFTPHTHITPGIKIDTRTVKEFIVENDNAGNKAWGLNIGCFDEQGNILNTDTRLLGNLFRINYWTYASQNPTTSIRQTFTVPEEVKEVVIMVNRYTRGFKVYGVGGDSRVVSPKLNVEPKINLAGYDDSIYEISIDSDGTLQATQIDDLL